MNYEEFRKKNITVSGSMSREKYLSQHYPDLYKKMMEFKLKINDSEKETFKELIYRYYKKDTENKKCSCGNDPKFISIEKGYSKYCSTKCSNINSVEKVKESKLINHGDPNYNNKEKFTRSMSKKSKEEMQEILEKRRSTKLKKYGDPNYTNVKKIQESKRESIIGNIRKKTETYDVDVIEILENSAYLIKCNKCNKESALLNSRINSRLRKKTDPCPVCRNHNDGTSTPENEIYDYIRSLGFVPEKNVRGKLGRYEIDIFIPEINIGFEYNGLFWHSEINTESSYHRNKINLAAEKGIKLINIWEDEWEYKREIVKSRIKQILGVQGKTIYARKCILKKVNKEETKKFLNENHLQGSCTYQYSMGLYFNNELVSICTFGRRKISGSTQNELLRFCNILYHHIPGAFSRFIKNYFDKVSESELITFADRSWSPDTNNIYTKNGFEHLYSTRPNYWYIVNKKRVHRYNYRKDVLVRKGYDETLSEREIMKKIGINRIYDCGQNKYILKRLDPSRT
jgi:hypothetical protein